jgi:hypothetical protein
MPTPEFASQLADLGAAALLIFLVALILIGLFRAWWAPNWVVADLRERASKAEDAAKVAATQAERNATSLETLARMLASGDRRAAG